MAPPVRYLSAIPSLIVARSYNAARQSSLIQAAPMVEARGASTRPASTMTPNSSETEGQVARKKSAITNTTSPMQPLSLKRALTCMAANMASAE